MAEEVTLRCMISRFRSSTVQLVLAVLTAHCCMSCSLHWHCIPRSEETPVPNPTAWCQMHVRQSQLNSASDGQLALVKLC